MNHPHFNFTVPVEIAPLLNYIREQQIPFTPAIVYWVSRVANEIPVFRWRIREEGVVEHETVQPSFTVNTEESAVFSFCTVDYQSDASLFIQSALETMEAMRTNPSMEDEHGRDDYLFLSAMPWISFTGCQHAMSYHPTDSVPRITWGKYYEEKGGVKMPLSVQVHHAIVDGRDLGQYFQRLEALAVEPAGLFERKY